MELNNIESLLLKYEEGNTSLEEERALENYFTSGNVPDHLKEYKMIFAFSANEKTTSYSREVEVGTKRKSGYNKLAWTGIAASIILAAGVFTTMNFGEEDLNQENLGTIEDPEEAYHKAKETLQLVSQVLNTGQDELTYVVEFDKAKNKYIKQ